MDYNDYEENNDNTPSQLQQEQQSTAVKVTVAKREQKH